MDQKFVWIPVILMLGFFLLLFLNPITIIDDGEVGVKKTLGHYDNEEIGTGVKLYIPIITQIYKVNTKLLTIEETVSVPSKEGLMVDLDISVIYQIRADKASEIMQTVSGYVEDTLLIPYMRNGIRDIVSGYEAKSVYSEDGRNEIASKLKLYLLDKLRDRMIISDALLRDVKLPIRVRESIEDKIDAEQKAQKKDFELISAQKDAEIEVARARGIAQSNDIIAGSITDEYLKWKFIESLSVAGADVIYVPTEANLPIMEATRGIKTSAPIAYPVE